MIHLRSFIAPRYTYLLTHWKKIFTGFGEMSYSEEGEDVFLNRHFFHNKKKGFYVDVGAFHPKLISNTYAFYKRGWHGINVDPNEEAVRLFKKYRTRDINLAIAVGSPGKKEYHRFAYAGGNTLSDEQKKGLDTKEWSHYLGSNTVECVPLKDILERYASGPIDLLDVDVEGLDLEVLQSNDWQKFRPHVVLVEDGSYDPSNPSASLIYAFMRANKYALRASLMRTLVFEARQ